jgi:hypothetical protein
MRMTVYAGYLNIAIGVIVGVGAIALGQPAFGGIMLVSLVSAGAFMVWLGQGWDKPLESSDELYRYGRPANATVMKVENEQLRPDGVRLARLTLHVAPVNESDYRTTRTLALPKGRVPAVGERLTVKFDPQSRKNVVLLEERFEVQDHVSAAREQMRTAFS